MQNTRNYHLFMLIITVTYTALTNLPFGTTTISVCYANLPLTGGAFCFSVVDHCVNAYERHSCPQSDNGVQSLSIK